MRESLPGRDLLPGLQIDDLDGITVQYDDWWFNVRPSNTEPLLRLNVEGPDVTEVAKRVDQILDLIH